MQNYTVEKRNKMRDIESREDVILMVDKFYEKVLKDNTIAFLFTDVAKVNWETHLPIMYNFWETILLDKVSYSGNPMSKHFVLDKKQELLPEHFERWKTLFIKNIDELFAGEIVNEAKMRANSIAYLMQTKIEEMRNQNN